MNKMLLIFLTNTRPITLALIKRFIKPAEYKLAHMFVFESLLAEVEGNLQEPKGKIDRILFWILKRNLRQEKNAAMLAIELGIQFSGGSHE